MLNVNVVPEGHGGLAVSSTARGRAGKGGVDDFAVMLAQTCAVAKAGAVENAPAEGAEVEDVAGADDVEPEGARDVEDAEPDSEVSKEVEPTVEAAAASGAAAAAEKPVGKTALAGAQQVAAGASGEAAAVDAVAPTAPAGDVVMAGAPSSAATQTSAPQTAVTAGTPVAELPAADVPTAKPAVAEPAVGASAQSVVDVAAEPAGAGKLLIEAPEPAAPVKTEAPAPEAAAAGSVSEKMRPIPPAAPVNSIPPVGVTTSAGAETAGPGAGAVESTLAGMIRDGARHGASGDSAAGLPAPAGDGPAAVPQVGPGAAGQSVAGQVGRGDVALPAGSGAVAVRLEHVGQYVVRSVRLMGQDGQKTLTVRLIPASLGELRLEVTTVRDGVQVRLMSANPVVREALESQLGSLRDTLARSGVEASSVTVSAGGADGGGQNWLAGARHEGGAEGRMALGRGEETGLGGAHQDVRRPRTHQGVLDVSV